jgi:hypothetical protein
MKTKICIPTGLDLIQKAPSPIEIRKPSVPQRIRRLVFTNHAIQRFQERFQVDDPVQIGEISKKVIKEGQVYMIGEKIVVKYDYFVLIGVQKKKNYIVITVIRATKISGKLKIISSMKPVLPKPFEDDLKIINPERVNSQGDRSTERPCQDGAEPNRLNRPTDSIKRGTPINSFGGSPVACSEA